MHGQKFFICTLCEKITTSKRKLSEHFEQVHGKVIVSKKLHACIKCDLFFESPAEMNHHLVTKHELSNNYSCHECNKFFALKALLTAHSMENHDYSPYRMNDTSLINNQNENKIEKKLKFQCDTCGKYLKSKDTLEIHKKQNHEKESHRYKCDDCDFTAFYLSILKEHTNRVHEGVKKGKKYKCGHCEYIAPNKTYLTKHEAARHQVGAVLYPCTQCNKGFTQESYLADHLLNDHDIIYKFKWART